MKKIEKPLLTGSILLAAVTFLMLILFFVFYPDNIMHSDMAAEVLLSKLMADNGNLIFCREWFYSTEIRVIYTQLIMTPLFHITSDFGAVKLISIIIMDVLLVIAFYFSAKDFYDSKILVFFTMALMLAPLSNEYLDMMFIGNFYTCQAICMFLMLKFFMKNKDIKKEWWKYLLLAVFALVLGLSGLRYVAALFVPLFMAVILSYGLDKETERKEKLLPKLELSIVLLLGSGIGFLINKLCLAKMFSFDVTTSEAEFLELSTVPERFVKSITMMTEFLGYRDGLSITTPLGLVNVVKFAFFVFIIYVVIYLFAHRYELKDHQRLLLYYFLGLFFLNWYMIIFTSVGMEYRYWLPIYIILVFLIGIYFENAKEKTVFIKPVLALLCVGVVLSSLYGELWQDTKYNDCAKRYGYMEFLESENYEFGYATFWNAEVTEYLSNGDIHVAGIGGKHNGQSGPYEWLCDKNYFREGYHTGKTFLLLQVTEEPALANNDITFMHDSEKVYEDEYYVIYEGEGMYLFSDK